jgi:hypothetical protein
LILGICLRESFFIGKHINNLIRQEIELSKSIQDKKNYANILYRVKFYQDGNMFYITFDKNIKIQQFKTKEGEQAIGYKK